ncbi:receptor-type tyrosine-protein phosphatase delta-like isoform X2 [Watersipora subatra]|uniref:receptor-type tyrosine-protein phosphatase delta-like isoform X2 n=1 Tax=Watersipora subatra TaxID=2589382 RepID=UPI00355B2527
MAARRSCYFFVFAAILATSCAKGQAFDDATEYPFSYVTIGSGTRNFAHLAFPEKRPEITVPPLSHKVPADSRVTLYCEASGFPAPEIFWRKNEKTLTEKRNRYIQTKVYSSTLTLESVSDKQAGTYECVANNGVEEEAVAETTIFVYEKGQALPEGYPKVEEITENSLTLKEKGFPMSLRCTITGDPEPEVIWYKDKTPVDVTSFNRVQVINRPDVPGSHDLQILVTEKEDRGDYVCMGRNVHGTIYSDVMKAFVKVRQVSPVFSIRPDPIYNVMAGGSLNLTCAAYGSPMPHVSWMEDGERPAPAHNTPIGRNVLVLTNIRSSKNYTCRASSELGTIMQSTQVRIQALPEGPDELWVNDITAISAKLQWKKSKQVVGPIETSDSQYFVQFRVYDYEPDSLWSEQGEDVIGYNLTYVLSGLLPYTMYECRVVPYINYGTGSPGIIRQFRTAETAPSSPPREVQAKAVSETSALIQWVPPLQSNGNIEGYNVLYCLGSMDAQPYERWMISRTTSSAQMVFLESLIEEETYSVAVQARNRQGTGPYSTKIQFTMVPGVPLAPVNLQVVRKTENSITLRWEKPEGEEIILSYEIYINDSRSQTPSDSSQPSTRSVYPPRVEYVLENLFPNTIYHIKMTARSEHGVGPHTPTIQVKTEESEPSSPPRNIQAKAPEPDQENSSTSLIVTWEAPLASEANGEITGYKLYYMLDTPQSDDAMATMQVIPEPTQTQIMLGNLRVWTNYRLWMKASTAIGDGPPSEVIIARSGQDVPDAPRGFSVLPLNSTAVVLSWRRPSERNAKGVIRGYQIFKSALDDNGMRIGDPMVINLIDGFALNYTVTGLEPRSKYIFQVRAFTVAGDGSPTGPKTVETLGAVPSAPQNMHLEIVEENPPTVRVSWNRPNQTHGPLLSYRIMWGKTSDQQNEIQSVNANQYSYLATRMMKGTEYEFRLQAENSVNYGVAAVDRIRTEDGVPSGSPQSITPIYVSDSSARVTWRELDPRLRNGVITSYQVRYQDQADPIDLRAVNTSETRVLLEDLTPGAKYFIQVVAFTSAGAGPTSHRVSYNTIQSRPPAPTNLNGTRISPTSIKLRWRPPLVAVTGYRIHYSTQDTGDSVDNWQLLLVNTPVNVYTVTNLEIHSAYAFKVQAVGANGDVGLMSQEAIVNAVMLPPQSEYSVQDLMSEYVTATSILLTWNSPAISGAELYQIAYTGHSRQEPDKTDDGNVVISASLEEKILEGLLPDYIYNIDLRARFEGEVVYRGDSDSASLKVATKAVDPPRLKQDVGVAIIAFSREENKFDEVYIIVALSVDSLKPSDIRLADATRTKRAVDDAPLAGSPYIAGRFDGQSTPNEFEVGDGREYGTYMNKKLEDGKQYRAFVRVLVQGEEFSSSFSSPFTSEGPVSDTSRQPVQPLENDMGLILGPIGGVIVIILIVVIVVVVIRRSKTQKEKAPEQVMLQLDQPPVYPTDPVELRRLQYSTPGMQSHPPIPILQLSNHIEQLRAQDNLRFSQEYESIEPGQQFTWEHSNLEYNKPKNRYANVIAYDHSRVVLPTVNGMPGADYINANYIDGYRKQNAYISTQGPLSETFGDFWRMMWEQRSATIVMMTKLEERARVKCDAYWPAEGSEMYGPIIVTLTDSMELATYTVRTFQIEKDGSGEKREVRQFQFTAWPDHGVPDYPTPLLIFMRRVKAATPSDSGPMVVHCSAGVGRTGAFIVIDAMLERIKHEKTVDIYGHVTCLRAQRNYMVQTEDQYIFIHDALLEAVLSGNTEIPARNLYTHIQKLTQPDGPTTGMEKEFKTLSVAKINPSRFATANLPVNKFKNRLINVLPYESNRVCLSPIRGVDGSDYINGSFIDGYRFKKAYIATQGPLSETVEDFWRMMWEHNCTIVVMLVKTKELGRDKCHQYWPETRSARYQYFVVDPHAEYNMSDYTLREFKVTDARDGQSRTVRLFHFNEWPEQGVPKSGMSFIQFIGQVHKTKEQFGQEGPITVHCGAGVGRTGVFITLSIILERMRYEGVVDMFQTVKMLRTQRQGMVQSEEQYGFCYQAALEHLASFDHY